MAVLTSCMNKDARFIIGSPDGNIVIEFGISDDGRCLYDIYYNDSIVSKGSKPDLLREDGNFSSGMKLLSASGTESVKDTYTLYNGKRRNCSYEGMRRTFHLINGNEQKIDIIFQVSNDGVAFRYFFPDSAPRVKKIEKELTAIHFPDGTKAWPRPMTNAKTGWNKDQPSYE